MGTEITTSIRELTRDGVRWQVREADTSQSPGARANRCLIFDADGIVYRAWTYPRNWSQLDDESLWAVLDRPMPRPLDLPRAIPVVRDADGTHQAVAAATEHCARSRSLLVELRLLRAANRAASCERKSLLEECQQVHRAMREAVEAYAQSLRSCGVTPEHALVLIKAALAEGLGNAEAREEPVAEELVSDGVAWGIAAYYAA